MKAMVDKIEGGRRVEYRTSGDELLPILAAEIKPGDVVMIKSSKGIGFAKIVEALLAKFPAHAVAMKPN